MPASPVLCDLDFEVPGKHFGALRLRGSSGSSLDIPIVSIRGGDGPTAIVFGGVHGDEPEGQVAALHLVRETSPEDVLGALIVVPCSSPEASRASTRRWPSGVDFNRLFPGNSDGSPDEQLAYYISRVLFPRAEIVVDMHSGGNSGMCLPWSEMHWVDNSVQRRRMVEAMLAWNTDVHFLYIDVHGTGLLVGEAERQGKIVVATELAGGGQVTATTHRIARTGLVNVLRHLGVLVGKVETRESLGLAPPVIVRATEPENWVRAPEDGLWETSVELGERVKPGQLVGLIHFIEHPEREASPVYAHNGGFVCYVRVIGTTPRDQAVVVVGREIELAELA